MGRKVNSVPQSTQEQKQTATTTAKTSQVSSVTLDLNKMGCHAIDKAADTATSELDKLDKEKPGTRRKVIGLSMLGGGLTGACIGGYLLLT